MRTTAAAGAGLLLANGTRLLAQTPGAGGKLNVALIGFGAQGRVLLESLLVIEGIQLVAVVDIWDYARTYADKSLKKQNLDVRTYENYEALLAGEKDLQAVVWRARISGTRR